MSKKWLRLAYLFVKFVPLFDEGFSLLFRFKSYIFMKYFGADGPLQVGRNANIGQAHYTKDWFLRIGKEVEVRDMVIIDYSGGLEIGDHTTFSSGAKVYTHNHVVWDKSKLVKAQAITFEPLIIGADVWVGAGTIILPGVGRIGQGAILCSGSVVYKAVPDFAVVAGNPARILGYRTEGGQQT